MIRRFVRAIVAAVTLFWAVPLLGLTPHSPVFIQDDAANPQRVNAGEEFFIALPSDPITGYSWVANVGDGKLLAYEGSIPQKPSSQRPPTSAQQLFIFHANRSGTTTITFNYEDAGGGPGRRTLTYYITVQ